MSRIERALEKANKMRHSMKDAFAEETNTAKNIVFPAKRINIMSNKSFLIGLILSAIVTSLLLFSIINYFVLENLTESLHIKSPTPSQKEELLQKVQPQGSVLHKEAMSLSGMKGSRKEINEESSQLQKPSKAIFTVQVGAFRNTLYAKALATRLHGKGYKVYITSLEEKDGRLFKVCVGNFNNRQKAEILSDKIKNTEDLQTFISLY